MNVYASSLWRYNNLRNIERFCISWRNAITKLWKIPYRTHNDLVYLINKCDPIVSILEKRRAIFYGIYLIVITYSSVEVVDIQFIIVTLLWVKISNILGTSIIFYIMIGKLQFE